MAQTHNDRAIMDSASLSGLRSGISLSRAGSGTLLSRANSGNSLTGTDSGISKWNGLADHSHCGISVSRTDSGISPTGIDLGVDSGCGDQRGEDFFNAVRNHLPGSREDWRNE